MQWAPGIPCALCFGGARFLQKPGRFAPRDCGRVSSRHCERSEAIQLPCCAVWIAHMGMVCVNKPSSLCLRSEVRAGFDDLVCLPDQTHIRSSFEATAPGFRLRRVGSRGRDHSSLRHLKPCNPSVRPPGSTEADRASADWFCWLSCVVTEGSASLC